MFTSLTVSYILVIEVTNVLELGLHNTYLNFRHFDRIVSFGMTNVCLIHVSTSCFDVSASMVNHMVMSSTLDSKRAVLSANSSIRSDSFVVCVMYDTFLNEMNKLQDEQDW